MLCILASLPLLAAGAAGAASRLDVRAGYDTNPDGATDATSGDSWAAVTLGRTLAPASEGRLSFSLDAALGATAYATNTELDRVSLAATPALGYVLSPRVSARAALVLEGQLVDDGGQNAWAWSPSLRVREQLVPGIDVAQYVSYRDLSARDPEHSGTKVAAGVYLRALFAERWLLGVGAEYAHGDFLASDVPAASAAGAGMGSGAGMGMGSGSGSGKGNHQALGVDGGDPAAHELLVAKDEQRLTGALGLFYDWSAALSCGVEYFFTRVNDDGGDEGQQSLVVSTTYSF